MISDEIMVSSSGLTLVSQILILICYPVLMYLLSAKPYSTDLKYCAEQFRHRKKVNRKNQKMTKTVLPRVGRASLRGQMTTDQSNDEPF